MSGRTQALIVALESLLFLATGLNSTSAFAEISCLPLFNRNGINLHLICDGYNTESWFDSLVASYVVWIDHHRAAFISNVSCDGIWPFGIKGTA